MNYTLPRHRRKNNRRKANTHLEKTLMASFTKIVIVIAFWWQLMEWHQPNLPCGTENKKLGKKQKTNIAEKEPWPMIPLQYDHQGDCHDKILSQQAGIITPRMWYSLVKYYIMIMQNYISLLVAKNTHAHTPV